MFLSIAALKTIVKVTRILAQVLYNAAIWNHVQDQMSMTNLSSLPCSSSPSNKTTLANAKLHPPAIARSC